MKPYFEQAYYPSFGARLHAHHPHYELYPFTLRLQVYLRLAFAHYLDAYKWRTLAFLLTILALYLGTTILFQTSTLFSDGPLLLFLVITVATLVYVLFQRQGFMLPGEVEAMGHNTAPLTLFNFRSKYLKKQLPQEEDYRDLPYSRYHFQYQQEGFQVKPPRDSSAFPMLNRQRDLLDFQRGRGRDHVDFGVIKYTPNYRSAEPKRDIQKLIDLDISKRHRDCLSKVNYKVEMDKFQKFLESRKGHSIEQCEFENAAIYHWMKLSLIPEANRLKLRLEAKANKSFEQLGYTFVWERGDQGNGGAATFKTLGKIFTLEHAYHTLQALRDQNSGYENYCGLLDEIRAVEKDLPKKYRAEFMKEVIKQLGQIIEMGRGFMPCGADNQHARIYGFKRLQELRDLYLSDIKNDSGNKYWRNGYPTDTQLLVHLFGHYIDTKKFDSFQVAAAKDRQNRLVQNYNEMGQVGGDAARAGPQMMDQILGRRVSFAMDRSAAVVIYSKSRGSYEPQYEVKINQVVYPTMPGVHSGFTAVAWFLRSVERANGRYKGAEYRALLRDVLALD